jgi:hypothetical protein
MPARAGAILAALLPLGLSGQIDQSALLERARAKIARNIEKLPKYTCLQTVHRSRFDAFPPGRVVGCGQPDPRMLAWSDRFMLDVTVSDGGEIFSWAGARKFQTGDVQKIVGGGVTGTGDFGPFLMSIFGDGASGYQYLGPEQRNGRTLAIYSYRVPLTRSRYEMKLNPRSEYMATLAYEGRFWIDTATADLVRMTIEVPEPPLESQTCRVSTEIDYQRARISGSDFLLPQVTVLKLWDDEGARHENRIEYASCRQFQSESVFRTDLDNAAAGPAAAKTPIPIPPGVTIRIALHTPIDSGSSFAGDAVEARLLTPIRSRNGQVLAAAGAPVYGRLVRFEQRFQPSNCYVVGLKFHSISAGGDEVPLSLTPVPRSRAEQQLAGPVERAEGIGMFLFQFDPLVLDNRFVTEWKTAAPREIE